MSEESKPIGIVCADITIRFPEIMEEEYKDLIKYLNDEHIVFEMTDNNNLQKRIDKAIEYINSTGYGTGFSMSAEEVDKLLAILKGDEHNE